MLPEMATGVPIVPIVGVKLVMVGGALTAPDVTVNESILVAVFMPTLTVIGPVVALAGTVVTSFVAVADVVTAGTPLKEIRLFAGVALKPTP